jgi:peptidoglycan/xylan/chitin deacetylase (PgdA/CDA1 family)
MKRGYNMNQNDERVVREKQNNRRKGKRTSIVMLCSISAALLLVGGLLLHGVMQQDNSVQIASANQAAVEEEQPVESEEDTNPFGIDAEKPMIALTFDDGPSQYTWQIVDTLQSHHARATFFVLGSRVATHQAAIDNTLAYHNEIASHTFAHKNLTKLTEAEALEQIRSTDEALQQQHQYTPALLRLPYGAKDEAVQEMLREEGKPIIGWSVDPYDWKVKDKDKVVQHILSHVQDGDIVLMHDIYAPTADAVAELVPALQEQGYQLVTVSELFQFRGVTPQAGQYYRSVPPGELD